MLLNPITGQKERVGRLLMMHANKREEIPVELLKKAIRI